MADYYYFEDFEDIECELLSLEGMAAALYGALTNMSFADDYTAKLGVCAMAIENKIGQIHTAMHPTTVENIIKKSREEKDGGNGKENPASIHT